MKDKDKTLERLINEFLDLHRRIAEFKESKDEHKKAKEKS